VSPTCQPRPRTELQQLDIDDLGLQTFSVPVTLPGDEIEAIIARIAGPDTLFDALAAFISQDAPSGDFAQNDATVEKLMADHPLNSLFPTVKLTAQGLPQVQATTPAEHKAQQLGEHETRTMTVVGAILGETLARILARFDPDEPTLAAILSPTADGPDVRAIARALVHFGRGDFEAAALVAIVRIEAILREHLKAAGVPLFTPQKGQTRGQYAQLGLLLSMMDGRIDGSWRRFLVTFLTSEWGVNYRNDLLHGFVDRVGRTEATLVLVAALHLLIWVQDPQPPSATPAGRSDNASSGEN
jgi:hypothetical protein